jgi:hypothetical protein
VFHQCSESRTYVPDALQKAGWTADYPQSIKNWNAERDVFVWLGELRMSIEEALDMYKGWLRDPPKLAGANILRRLFSKIFGGKCHHGVNTYLEHCSNCDIWHKECVEYLNNLLPKVKDFYHSKSFWESLNPYEFEKEVAALFQRYGWVANVTRGSGDEGVDIFLEKDNQKAIVQCKKHINPIGPAIARELLGAVVHHKSHLGILVCTGGFTSGVYQFAQNNPIKLMRTESLIKMQLEINQNMAQPGTPPDRYSAALHGGR